MAPFEIVRALWAVRVAVAVTAVVLPTPGTAIAENEAVPAPVAVGNMSQNVLATVILAPGQAAIPVAAPQAPALAVAAAAAATPAPTAFLRLPSPWISFALPFES